MIQAYDTLLSSVVYQQMEAYYVALGDMLLQQTNRLQFGILGDKVRHLTNICDQN